MPILRPCPSPPQNTPCHTVRCVKIRRRVHPLRPATAFATSVVAIFSQRCLTSSFNVTSETSSYNLRLTSRLIVEYWSDVICPDFQCDFKASLTIPLTFSLISKGKARVGDVSRERPRAAAVCRRGRGWRISGDRADETPFCDRDLDSESLWSTTL